MTALDRVIANIEGRFRLAEDHMRHHDDKTAFHNAQAEKCARDIARYSKALDVLREIEASGEIVE